jgi:hypothetical protein
MLSLAELQRALRRVLLDGESDGVAALIRADGLAAEARLDVYRTNVFVSLGDALQSTFPAVCRLVDERFFAYAAAEFVREHPPERACLAEYGARFPDFLADFPPCRDLAYLADVARLEWLLHRAAMAPAAPRLSPAALADVAAEDQPRLIFRLHPALGLLASAWPVDRIWRANRADAPDDTAIKLDAGGVRLEVSRLGEEVALRALSPGAFAFREALRVGASLETATKRSLAADEHFDLARAFADLFRDGAVTGVALAPLRHSPDGG